MLYVWYVRPGMRVLGYKGRSKKQAEVVACFRRACGYYTTIEEGVKKPKVLQELVPK